MDRLHRDTVQLVKAPTQAKLMEKILRTSWAPWGKLYRKSVHENVFFPIGEFSEDEAIALYILDNCKIIVETNALVYHYRYRSNSTMTSAFSPQKLDWYKHCKNDLEWISKSHPELEALAQERLFRCITFQLTQIAASEEKYWYLAKPLLKDFKQNYVAIRKCHQKSGTTTVRLMLLRYIPYWCYGKLTRTLWIIRHGNSN